MAAEEEKEMGVTVGEKGPATADKEMGKMRATKEEKGEAATDKEAMAEKEEKGATARNEEKGEEEETIAMKRGQRKAKTGENEEMFAWLSGITISVKGTTAVEGESRERRCFKRTNEQRSGKKAEMAEAMKEAAGEKETLFFRTIGKIITLTSSDGMLLMVSEEEAKLSVLLADMIEQDCAGSNIPLPNVDARALATVIEYCNKHADASANHCVDEGGSSSSSEASGEALKEWDRKLVDGLSQDTLYDLILAANFLHIKGLLEAACQKVTDMIKSKTPEQVRKIFSIANEFTKEEEEEMESPWAFNE